MRAAAANDRVNRSQPVGAVGLCDARLEAQIALVEMGIARGDIRRVGDDHIEETARAIVPGIVNGAGAAER